MWYEIKWQCVEVDYDGCLGDLDNTIHSKRCEDWESALGCYISHINMDEIARVWWVCHSVENDLKGHVMSGYTAQWGEHVTLKTDNHSSLTGVD